nr:hypothetical protein HmN_000775800 [Hymenolepis microstoma]
MSGFASLQVISIYAVSVPIDKSLRRPDCIPQSRSMSGRPAQGPSGQIELERWKLVCLHNNELSNNSFSLV